MIPLVSRNLERPGRRSAVAWGASAALLVTLAPALTVSAEPSGTARGLSISAPPPTPGFEVEIGDLLASGATASKASFSQQTQSGSTAQDWRAAREAKRGNLSVPQKTGAEAGLAWLEDGHWLQRIRNGWHGFLPSLGGFPSGSGQAFGLSWTKPALGVRYPSEFTPNRIDLRGQAAFSLRGYYLGLFEVGWGRIGGSPIYSNVHVGYQHNANESFYGFGQDSSVEDRISFAETVAAAGGVVWWRAPQWLYIGGGIGYRDTDVGEGEDDFAPPPDFNPDDMPGFVEQVEFITYDAFVQVDWRNEGNPYRGGLYAVRYTDWRDYVLDDFSFTELDVELQQYIPFLMNKRVIALRARTVLTDPHHGQEVPFYLMPTLGGTRDLRGFNYSRFRDRNMILFNAEYRAEIWVAMDLALFVDAGKVFFDRNDFNLDDLATDFGVGLRLKTTLSTFLRADFAFGGEGFHTAITFDNVFDSTPLFTRILQTVQ